ncbi:MAG: HD domain-containing protein [bacterium]|nr:HD domain-containing protein [bacterium]
MLDYILNLGINSIFVFMLSFFIGIVLYIITLKTYKYGIKNFQNKVIKQDYVVSISDFIFILISLIYYDKLFLWIFTLAGYIIANLFSIIFIKKQFNIKFTIFAFFNTISLFIPLILLSFIISFLFSISSIDNILINLFNMVAVLLILFLYIIFNKILTIFMIELFNFFNSNRSFIDLLKNLIKRVSNNFIGYLEVVLFSQAVLAFIFFIFYIQKNYFNCFIVLLIVFSIYYIDKILFDLYSIYDKTIEMVLDILEEYDFNTLEHSKRVAFISKELASYIGLSHEEVYSIELAAKLHDIGKLDIPSFILNKKSKLNNFEYKLITFHPIISAQISQNILNQDDLAFIKYHHLYPTIENRKITYKDVPLGARVITIADIYDALRSKRSYKKGLSHEEVIKEMSKDLLKDVVDPYLFIKFLDIYPKIRHLYEE